MSYQMKSVPIQMQLIYWYYMEKTHSEERKRKRLQRLFISITRPRKRKGIKHRNPK